MTLNPVVIDIYNDNTYTIANVYREINVANILDRENYRVVRHCCADDALIYTWVTSNMVTYWITGELEVTRTPITPNVMVPQFGVALAVVGSTPRQIECIAKEICIVPPVLANIIACYGGVVGEERMVRHGP